MTAAVFPPDLLLARRAVAGQPEAWDEILRLYAEKIYNLALHFTGCRTEADDLTQEIFLRLYRNLRLYRGDVPLGAWALRLSRNVCIDHYRRARREQRWSRMSEEILDAMPAEDDPLAEVTHREQLATVYQALGDMSEETALVIVLRDLQGLTLEEIAEQLELPVGTIKSRLHRGRIELAGRVTAMLAPSAATAAATALPEVGSC
jgi:RNA polymerase sigma-70 factor (ECF subfamily)